MLNKHTVPHLPSVTRQQRETRNQHRAAVLWFTGLSGAGKSTLAHAIEARLYLAGCRTYVLDGDNVRQGLCRDLGFTAADRQENIRRIAELAKIMLDAGLITLTAFISPFRADRENAKTLITPADFIEIYCKCDLAICEQRDVKGLYQKSRNGEILNFTGISSPYEEPVNPELTLDTGRASLEECVTQVLELLAERGIYRSR